MKYKVGDKVTLTNGDIMTVDQINDKFKWYLMREDPLNCYTDEMIEGLVEDEMIDLTSIVMETVEEKTIQNALTYGYNLPEGYQFVDENGNVINATKIVLEKKKKEYPKTYEECCKILGVDPDNYLTIRNVYCYDGEEETIKYERDLLDKFDSLWELIICRDAYWKIAGEEMGLGKPWEPSDSDYITGRYCIFVHQGNIICSTPAQDCILTFPTEEMRDAFYENFKELINECKELL